MVVALDRGHQHSHGDRKDGGQHAPQHKYDPPRDRERPIRLRQDREELPFVPRVQTL
jgi:hypothetical protein